MTVVRFSGGEVIRVSLALDEVRELLQQALAQNALLELTAPDGETMVINPHQVQILQDGGDDESLGDGLRRGRVQTAA